jgi:hypothetical protein
MMLYRCDDLDIEIRLKRDLNNARAEYQAACQQFQSIIKDLPSEIPQPDGELRIRQSGTASRAALQNYRLALMRFSDYCISGTVPEDLLSRKLGHG